MPTSLDDPRSKARVVVSQEHRLVQNGRAFIFSGTNPDVPRNETRDFLVQPCVLRDMHAVKFHVRASEGPIRLELYEDPTIADWGQQAPAVRANRREEFSDQNANSKLYSVPDITEPGELLAEWEGYPASSRGAAQVESVGDHWVLGALHTYLFRLSNLANRSIRISAYLFWYEWYAGDTNRTAPNSP